LLNARRRKNKFFWAAEIDDTLYKLARIISASFFAANKYRTSEFSMLFGFEMPTKKKKNDFSPMLFSLGCHFVQINDLNLVHGSNLNGKIC